MTMPSAQLAFFKLNVAELDAALAFWREAFGFAVAATFDEPDFLEHVLVMPGQEGGPNLMLVQHKTPPDAASGSDRAYGPVGLICEDVVASFARAVEAGALPLLEPFAAGGALVALLQAPQGHEIELVQLPA